MVEDPEIWSPAAIRADRGLEIPASGSSRSCEAWRSLAASVPVGDRGGPMFVRRHPGEGSDWWPVNFGPGECVVSFVLAIAAEARPFLDGEER